MKLNINVKGLSDKADSNKNKLKDNLPNKQDNKTAGSGSLDSENLRLLNDLIEEVRNSAKFIVEGFRNALGEKSKEGDSEDKKENDDKKTGTLDILKGLQLNEALNSLGEAFKGASSLTNPNDSLQMGAGAVGGVTRALTSALGSLGMFGGGVLASGYEMLMGNQQRSFDQREAMFQDQARMRAISGSNFGGINVDALRSSKFGGFYRQGAASSIGLDQTEIADIAIQAVQAAATARAGNEALSIAGAQRGFGIDTNVSTQILAQGRFTQQGTLSQELSRTFLQLKKDGILSDEDRAIFSELLQAQSNLVDFLSQSQEQVSREEAFRTIRAFSGLGGRFSQQDPRSSQLIESVINSLQNPGSEVQQALQFNTISGALGPGASTLDVLKQQEQIGSNPELISRIIQDFLAQSGGNVEQAVLSSRSLGVFQDLSLQDLERLFQNPLDLSLIDQLADPTDTEKLLLEEARKQTSLLEQQRVDISDAFIQDAVKGTVESLDVFTDRFIQANKELGDVIGDKIKGFVEDSTGVDVSGIIESIESVPNKISEFFEPISELMSELKMFLSSIKQEVTRIFNKLPF